MRADQRAEKAPRRVDEKRDAHEKRVPAPRAARRTRDRARHETGQPHRSRRLLWALGPRVGRETEPGDGDEQRRQEPDEEPVRERAGDDPAAGLDVTVDHLEHDVDGLVALSLRLHALGDLPRARLEPPSPGRRSQHGIGRLVVVRDTSLLRALRCLDLRA